jgi:hypothetical protein
VAATAAAAPAPAIMNFKNARLSMNSSSEHMSRAAARPPSHNGVAEVSFADRKPFFF